MKHSRQDYQNRIVDLAGIIPENEPVFLLRAKDACATAPLHTYLTELVRRGAGRDMIASVNAAMLSFARFAKDNAGATKLPDIGIAAPLPVSDSPILQQALNRSQELEEKAASLAGTLEKVTIQLDEYSERYSQLKSLHERLIQIEGEKTREIESLSKQMDDKNSELTRLKFDLKTANARAENLSVTITNDNNVISTLEKHVAELVEKNQNLETALKNNIESDKV
jgi:hypothetical protein